MKTRFLLLLPLLASLIGQSFGAPSDIDQQLAALAEKLALPIADHQKKKVTVLDFADLHGNGSDLGKYIAEQLTVDLVMAKRPFAVLDRANLKSILAEHKLTSQGLVDPENAKKLGMFAGVDVLVLGVIIPKSDSITLTAKLITTDTAEVVGAARAEFKADEQVQQLISHRIPDENKGGPGDDPKPKVIKTIDDLEIAIESLRIANENQFLLNLKLSNQSSRRSLWVALNTDVNGVQQSRILDSNGNPFHVEKGSVSGIDSASFDLSYQRGAFAPATEIRLKDSISAMVKFISPNDAKQVPGLYTLQLELISGEDLNHSPSKSEVRHILTKVNIE